MRAIGERLERLLYTRPVRVTTADQLKALLRWERGSTRQVAAVLGVSQRTVQRWVTPKPGSQGRPNPATSRGSRNSCGPAGSR
ncbi:helix-turn-helix domain-containing protein [Streptomyces polychromogenes]|nr:helix-turn-helix domain-containing protein [Streptomyces polychromogenes]